MTSEKLGNTRVTGKEQYYTPSETASQVLDRVLSQAENNTARIFLEPAGGTGAFIDAALSRGFKEILSLDIEPHHDLVKEGDFLQATLELEGAICVSNPPFGRNNSLSIPFFNKAALHSDLIAFVVPRSWRKWSVINRLDYRFHLVDDWDLEIDYVDQQGQHSHGIGNLRTCVQVWKRDDSKLRAKIDIPDHGLISKSSPEEADVAFTLFGYSCGAVKEEFPRVKNSTLTFFKLHHPRALEALKSVDFSRFYKHTAYTEALGIKEINFLLNEYLGLETMKYSNNPSDDSYLGLNQGEQLRSGDHPRIF